MMTNDARIRELETSLMACLANMSDDQRTHITARAIDILRTKNQVGKPKPSYGGY
jgi:hypothetical protein